MQSYKIIAPPFTLKFGEMTKKELVAYYNWYIELIPERIEILEDAVNSTPGYEDWRADFSVHSLDKLGQWFAEQVEIRQRTEVEKEELLAKRHERFKTMPVGETELTNKTFSLAMDIGMYIGQVFVKNNPSLKWTHWLKGGKRFVDYGQAVIEGFKNANFNPNHMIVVLAYSLVKKKDWKALRELYDIWKEYVK